MAPHPDLTVALAGVDLGVHWLASGIAPATGPGPDADGGDLLRALPGREVARGRLVGTDGR